MSKHRVLVDLKVAMNKGYCGIAKENRLVFKMLAQAGGAKVDGLLVSENPASVFTAYSQPKTPIKALEQANQFFHEAFQHQPKMKSRLLRSLRMMKIYALKNKVFELFELDPIFQSVIWRAVFDKSLKAEDRELLLEQHFLYTNLTDPHLGINAYFKRKVRLKTEGYDFALFQEPSPVAVSPGTIKLVRYHDAIPVTDPDFTGSLASHKALNTLSLSEDDSYFICNSEPTRETLLHLRPGLEKRALTIPCAISTTYQRVNNEATLRQIIAARLSTQLLKREQTGEFRQKILKAPALDYILSLATLDPKKNQLALIKAWERLNHAYPEKPVKLVMAANPGWFSQEVKALMLPHIEMGNLIHLDNLSVDDLPYLFSQAKAFVFPSLTEGFGLPPLEAMQCGCPTLVSDIPAHRWVLGEAASYCNPYDVDSLTEGLAKLLHLPDAERLRQDLALKGLERVKLYTEEKLMPQWAALFDQIKAKE